MFSEEIVQPATRMDLQGDPENGVSVLEEEAKIERGRGRSPMKSLLPLLSHSVSIANVWRFAHLCYRHGGGTFLLAYLVLLNALGVPVFLAELIVALGLPVYSPPRLDFRGLKWGMVVVSFIQAIHDNTNIAWLTKYLVVSFGSISELKLPWQNYNADWCKETCYSYEEASLCEALNGSYHMRKCFNQTDITEGIVNVTSPRSPAEEYFTNHVLGISADVEGYNHARWMNATNYAIALVITFMASLKNIRSFEIVPTFCTMFISIITLIQLLCAVTLPGAFNGIEFFLTPDFSKLKNAQLWGDAAVHIFFALSPAWGGRLSQNSYNIFYKFVNNCYVDSLKVAAASVAVSVATGLVMFCVLGFQAQTLNVDVDKVVNKDVDLPFVVYPEIVTRLPLPSLWSILFFGMILIFGLNTQLTLMDTLTVAISDVCDPNIPFNRNLIILSVSAVSVIGGLFFTTQTGLYWVQVMDSFPFYNCVLLFALVQCIQILWVYGANNFCRDVQRVIGKQSKLWLNYWTLMWKFITPSTLVIIIVANLVAYTPVTYGDYVPPRWADPLGWLLGLVPLAVALYTSGAIKTAWSPLRALVANAASVQRTDERARARARERTNE